MLIAPGSHAGPYLLLEKIGEGGKGAVFHARQQSSERDVKSAGEEPSPQTDGGLAGFCLLAGGVAIRVLRRGGKLK